MPATLQILMACLVIPLSAFGYSAEGHEIIADVAQKLISGTPASNHVKELLGSYSMAEVSTWADKIKGGNSPDEDLNAWRDANRALPAGKSSARHNLHHYTNIPIQEEAYSPASIGTDPDDIVHAMKDCILILKGQEPSASFRGTSPKVAMILLIHIHYYWDRSVVDGTMQAAGFTGHPKAFSNFLVKQIREERFTAPSGNVGDWPTQYVTKMIPDSRKAYLPITNSDSCANSKPHALTHENFFAFHVVLSPVDPFVV